MKRIILLMAVIIIVLSMITLRSCRTAKETAQLYKSAQDTLSVMKDENGRQTARINSFQAETESAFLEMKSKDSNIVWLQTAVKKYKGKVSAMAVVSTSTNDAGSTTTIIVHDSNECNPTYKTEWHEEWSEGIIVATSETIERNIKFKSDFEVVIGKSSNKIFQKRELNLEIRNLNPNTTTTAARSVLIKQEQKRINFGLNAGYGVDLLTFKPVLYLGVGASFTVFGVK
jgi:hypothetical protein